MQSEATAEVQVTAKKPADLKPPVAAEMQSLDSTSSDGQPPAEPTQWELAVRREMMGLGIDLVEEDMEQFRSIEIVARPVAYPWTTD